MRGSLRFISPRCRLLCCVTIGLVLPALAMADTARFNIASQPLPAALKAFARQAHMQLLYEYGAVQGVMGNAVSGTRDKRSALKKLLRNTHLEAVFTSNNAATIRPMRVKQSPIDPAAPRRVSEPGRPRQGGDPDTGTATARPKMDAQPATQDSGHLGEIIVTAEKRAESLENVPVTDMVISKVALVDNLAHDLNSIGELVPQVFIGRSVTGTGAVLTIRGISSSPADSGLSQSVLLDVDGVAIDRGRIVQSAMFDTESVQVLEGPQALFFGKDSPAGVIDIQSVDPTNHLEGYAKAGYEFAADEKYAEAAISGPLASDLNGRLALRYDSMDGWIKNIAPAEANPFQSFAPLPGAAGQHYGPNQDDITGRLTLLWGPTDSFTAKLKLTINGEKDNADDAGEEPFCGGGQTIPVILGTPEPHADCSTNMVKAESDLPPVLAGNYPFASGGMPYLHSDLRLASLVLNEDLPDVTLTSTTGYYYQNHRAAFTGDDSEFAQIWDVEAERYEMVSQEFLANTTFSAPVNFMAGAYYEHSNRMWFNIPDLLNLYNSVAGNYTTTTATSQSYNDSFSGFGQIRWTILPGLSLAGGARYTHDEKNTTLLNYFGNPAAAAVGIDLYPDGVPIDARYAGNDVSPEVTLAWSPVNDQTLYAAYKTGYKAGGISNPALLFSSASASNLVFGPEKTHGFEAGYKALLLERTLRFDLTAYRYDYDGLQVSGYEPQLFTFTIQNAAQARIYGVTGSFEYLAAHGLSFNGNLGWNVARYLQFPNAECYAGQTAELGCVGDVQNLAGRALNRAPKITYRLGADYLADLVSGWTADLSLSGAYSSSYETDPSYSPGGFQASYWLLDAALHVRSADEHYTVSLIGRDLTNSYYKVFTNQQSFGSTTQYNGEFNRPREVVLELSYEF